MKSSAFFEHRVRREDRYFLDAQKLRLGVFDGVGAATSPDAAAEIARDEIQSVLNNLSPNPEEKDVREALKSGWNSA